LSLERTKAASERGHCTGRRHKWDASKNLANRSSIEQRLKDFPFIYSAAPLPPSSFWLWDAGVNPGNLLSAHRSGCAMVSCSTCNVMNVPYHTGLGSGFQLSPIWLLSLLLGSCVPFQYEATMPESRAVANVRRDEIERILKENWIGPRRNLLLSLNEFRHWDLEEVHSVFSPVLTTRERLLSPLGPGARYPPPWVKRWKYMRTKIAIIAAVNTIVLLCSPMLWLSKQGQDGFISMPRLNFEMLSSSFFVRPSNGSITEAVRTGKALCVNKWGQCRILDKGFAAISDVWAETMGFEFHDEKIEQDERGLNFQHSSPVMAQATKCGFDWIWLELLAIPRNSDGPTKSNEIRDLKTRILNSLHNVYRSAEAVLILDSLNPQLKSNDPFRTATILCCGRWLTRIWTYQEIKLARKAFVVTADR